MKDSGVSSVVGVVLLVGITVVMGAIYALVAAVPEPNVDKIDSQARGRISNGLLELTNHGPADIPLQGSRLVVEANGTTYTTELTEVASQTADGKTWTVGERLCLVGHQPHCRHQFDGLAKVTLYSQNQLVWTLEVNMMPAFTIGPDGAIIVNCPMRWDLEVVGTDITYGNPGPDIPVYVNVSKNGAAPYKDVFFSAPVDAGFLYHYGKLSPGARLGAQGTASYSSFWSQYSSFVGDPHVVTLRDGDPVPTHAAYGSQVPVGTMLYQYVDNGTISLSPVEVIVLYEFNNDLTVPAADFQDLVLIFRTEHAYC